MKHDQSRIRNGEIVARITAGETAGSLAAEYGLTPNYIRVLATKAGIKLPPMAGASRNGISAARAKKLKRRAAMCELHSLGIPGGVARQLLGVSLGAWQGDIRHTGLRFTYGTTRLATVREASKDRASEMVALYRAGCTLEAIGAQHGITRERVRQLMTKHFGITADDGGAHLLSERSAMMRDQRREQRSWARHGCSWADYVALRAMKKPTRAYGMQKRNAITRGIGWNLTLWQWWTIWQQSGKWAERGRRGDAFVMCRKSDLGPYSPDNVYIATLRHNSSVQPNNPYRKNHPDHEKVMAEMARPSRAQRGCSIEGCLKPHYGQGYCNNHYYHFVTKPGRAAGEREAA